MTQRWRIVLEYDGTDFEGWQIQPGRRTIQGELEAALARILGHPSPVLVSGRTDAGVHAEGQVAAFDAAVERSADAIRAGLNGELPPDLACVRAEPAVPDFDPRRWAWGKTYRYTWLDRPSRSPLRRRRAWHVRPLDEEAMRPGAAHLLGVHDFSSFRAAGCGAAHPVREVAAISVHRVGDEVRLEVKGHGFLRHMVRIIAGTLTEVGLHKRDPSWVLDVLRANDRSWAGRTAPAQGLTLVEVRYGEGPPPWSLAAQQKGRPVEKIEGAPGESSIE